MKLSQDCGLSFRVWSNLTVVFEIVFSFVTGGLAGWVWLGRLGGQARFLYSPESHENYIIRNGRYESLVTTWILSILLSLCLVRIISAVLLLIGVKKSSVNLSKYWIAFKILAAMISLFLLTSSFTVPIVVRAAAGTSLATDLISSYFIVLLYPELDKMSKQISVTKTSVK